MELKVSRAVIIISMIAIWIGAALIGIGMITYRGDPPSGPAITPHPTPNPPAHSNH